ncbi:MAG TPA: hypothetical protein VL970_06610 [Candidatus Acidoferrales bacterium]|nr:hypothetical protein [Candidatus Acidoferrales bacterium]
MKKTMSTAQWDANRRNARNSTGPKTDAGKAVAKLNALRHGILSQAVLVRGRCLHENQREFAALHRRLCEDLQPVGLLEEMLVEDILNAHWRLRRVLKAEAGEIALNVDTGEWDRNYVNPMPKPKGWTFLDDSTAHLWYSRLGQIIIEKILQKTRAAIEQAGELTKAAIELAWFRGEPTQLSQGLEEIRIEFQPKPDTAEPGDWRTPQKAAALAYLDERLRFISWLKPACELHEEKQEQARQAAAMLPAPEVLDKIVRYETKLERQLHRAMNQLERLQRRRLGEAVPPPLAVDLSETA